MHKTLERAKLLCLGLIIFSLLTASTLQFLGINELVSINIILTVLLLSLVIFGILTFQRLSYSRNCSWLTHKSLKFCTNRDCFNCNVALFPKDKDIILGKVLPLALEHRFWRWM